MPPHHTATLLPALVTLSCLTGCASERIERQPRTDTRPMVGEIRQAELDWAWVSAQDWVLVSIEGQAPITGTTPWIRFREHTWLEGDAGCNRFTAGYERKADSGLRVSEIISTRMFCAQPEGAMQQESRLFYLLQSVDAYHAEPQQLQLLSDGAVTIIFVIETDPDTVP